MQFKLKVDLSDSIFNLFSFGFEKSILLPAENFLTISYIIDDDLVVFPSSIIWTLEILWIKIKSRSVAVIVNFPLLTSNKTLDKIGRVLLFSITPWQ